MAVSGRKTNVEQCLTPEQRMAWDNLILHTPVGSHLYGTDTPSSDLDFAGIFIPSEEYVLGLKRCDQVEWKTNSCGSGKRNGPADIDRTFYSLPKYTHLAAGCNPNIIELLFAPEPWDVVTSINKQFGEELVAARKLFLSQRIRKTFVGYARSQRMKLVTKKDRLDAIRASREAFSRTMWYQEEQSEVLLFPHQVKGVGGSVYHTFEKGQTRDLVARRLDEMEQEYGTRIKSVQDFGYDTKFAAHLIRLLNEGIDLLTTGELRFPLPNRDLYKQIRQGDYSLEELLSMADTLSQTAETCESSLPPTCNFDAVSALQTRLLKNFWRLF